MKDKTAVLAYSTIQEVTSQWNWFLNLFISTYTLTLVTHM